MSEQSAEDDSYFPNNLPDYEPNSIIDPKIDEYLKNKINELTDKIWNYASKQTELENEDIYSGNIGIAYMFWYLSQQKFSAKQKKDFLTKAKVLISQSLNSMAETQKPLSFSTESSGICLIASLIFDSTKDEELRDYYLNFFNRFTTFYIQNDINNEDNDNLFDGRAGLVCASLLANKLFKTKIISPQILQNIGISTIKSGKLNSLNAKSKLPIIYQYKGEKLLDISHGMSGILLSMLCTPDFFKIHPKFEKHIKTCVDFILSQQTLEGSYVTCNRTQKQLLEWCDGSSGVSWLMSKAYKLWNENKYKDSLIRCGELIWRKGLSCKGPAICNGIAGNGYTFLLLFRITSDPKYIHRAKQFSQFLLSDEYIKYCETLDKAYSLYEGMSGIVCYLVDALEPQQALFPLFFDIFNEENSEISEDLVTMSDSIKDPLKTVDI